MMTMLFYILSFLLSIMFIFMNHPLALGLTLLIQTLMISMSVGLLLPSFWFSYILFLVFLGGMLVLFIYVASLASNEMFSFSSKLTLFIVGSLMLLSSFMMIWDFMYNSSSLTFIDQVCFMYNNQVISSSVFKMYNSINYMLTLTMIIYLLLTLIIVANIVMIQEGPLRPLT